MELSVLFAGTGGSVPTARRALPATLVTAGGERLLFDCGEGTQRQLLQAGGLPDLDAVFITHFHADHWLGLPGMLKTFELRGRETSLPVYGPPGLQALLDGLRPLIGRVAYGLEVVELDRHDEVGFDEYVIEAVPVDHPVTAAILLAQLADPDRQIRHPVPFDPEPPECEPGPDRCILAEPTGPAQTEGRTRPIDGLGFKPERDPLR